MSAKDEVRKRALLGRRGSIIAREMLQEKYTFSETVLALLLAGFIVWSYQKGNLIALHVSDKPYKNQDEMICNSIEEALPFSSEWVI